jgi:hypothetical protein
MIRCTTNILSYENILSYIRAVLVMYSAEGRVMLLLSIWSATSSLQLFSILITYSHFFS